MIGKSRSLRLHPHNESPPYQDRYYFCERILWSGSSLPGDKIYIILGCALPVILRKVDNGYRLIGDSYVHGIMKGEVMEELQKGNVELEDICLI